EDHAKPVVKSKTPRQHSSKPLPDHRDRHDEVLSPGDDCGRCDGHLKTLGKDVTEELEYVPGRFVVNRIIQPRKACTCCEAIVQSPLPSRSIEPGRPGPGLLAHVLVSKYADHLPLYRQSQIYAHDGVDLDRSTMSDWVGRATALLEPLADLIGRMARQRRIHILRYGLVDVDNNTAGRAVKPVAIGRKNWMFAGSQGGGKAMAIAYTLIETAKLNNVDPQAWLT
ncbi:MAG: transposase, partial [Pseudoprimorskyibacter sp.]|nr:transposase [Pseudoprimorskyibacter sp.]